MCCYWPRVKSKWLLMSQVLFFCVFVSVTKNAKKNKANIQPSWPNKPGQSRFYCMAKERTFTCGTNTGNPERAWWVHLTLSGSQSECRILLLSWLQLCRLKRRRSEFKSHDLLLCRMEFFFLPVLTATGEHHPGASISNVSQCLSASVSLSFLFFEEIWCVQRPHTQPR